jgi:stage V sporulation protein D (sporulation-specific penicillin-binding protein)
LHKKRLVVLLVFVIIVFLLLTVRIGYWTFYRGEWLQSQAEGQWTQDVLVAAQRGSILDRNGNVLAQSASADTVILRPEQVENPEELANNLSAVLEMDRETIYEKATDTEKSEVWLKRQISREQADEIRAMNMDGVYFTTDVKRYYPNKDLLCQVVGFTSVDGEGLLGLEKQYDKYLAGKAGRTIAETDKNGRELAAGYEFFIEPEEGYNLVLSVDAVVQGFLEAACEEAYQANGAKSVQGIVMDPASGEIIAMATIPGYDLNDPPRNDAKTLETLSENRVAAEAFEPGALFEAVTAAAALDAGSVAADFTYDCSGSLVVDGETIACSRPAGHGTQTLTQAMQNACGPCFAQVALNMGLDTFYRYVQGFGFGRETGIDFISDETGLLPDQKYIKNIDIARIGTGKSLTTTPLQLASAIGAVVNGGTLYQPKLVSEMTDSEGNVIQTFEPVSNGQVISGDTSSAMRQMLLTVVEAGNGKNAQIPGYSVGGMAATTPKYDETGEAVEGKTVSSFIGFAPADNPQYVVLILIDEPGGDEREGSVIAAPYVKEVLEQALTYDNVPPVSTGEAPETVTVPGVVGLDAETARSQIEAAGLTCTVDGSGSVTGQLPSPETVVVKGSEVTLYTTASGGQDPETNENMAQVPDVSGMTAIEARDTLEAAGFEIDIRSSGRAVRQTPAGGEYAQKGSLVTVYFTLDAGDLPVSGQ